MLTINGSSSSLLVRLEERTHTQCPATPDGLSAQSIPGRISPFFSASSIMFLPMRSLTLLHGSMVSSLAATRAPAPAVTVFSHTCQYGQGCVRVKFETDLESGLQSEGRLGVTSRFRDRVEVG